MPSNIHTRYYCNIFSIYPTLPESLSLSTCIYLYLLVSTCIYLCQVAGVREPPWSDENVEIFADNAPHVASGSGTACTAWLDSLLTQDGMVDTFCHFHPNARRRFTCWEQYRNMR